MAWDTATRVEVVAGKLGFLNILNGNRVPLGGLVALRNATLADHAWRTGDGAAKLGAPPAAIIGRAGIDYWPTLAQQRTVAVYSDGTIRKDNGAGAGWATIHVGPLTMVGAVPMFAMGGQEAAGNNRKLFYADRINAPLFLDGDGAAMAALSVPHADWSAGNRPGWFCPHQSYNWAGGNANAYFSVYRSLAADHGDFNTTSFRINCGPLQQQERTVGGISYKGGLVVFCFPVGVYFIDTTTDPNPANWFAAQVAVPGAAGPRSFCQLDEDVVWIGPNGSWHSLRSVFGQQKASIQATDLSYSTLTDWARINLERSLAANFDVIFHEDRREFMLGYVPAGATAKTRRLHGYIGDIQERGGAPAWILWDRDINEAMFLRKSAALHSEPTIIDDVGQLWTLEEQARNKDGAAYTLEILMQDTDFAMVQAAWAGRKKNGCYYQIEYVATSTFEITVEVVMDGAVTQTDTIQIVGQTSALPVVLPFDLTERHIASSDMIPMLGQFRRLALRVTVSQPDVDCVITKFIFGANLAAT